MADIINLDDFEPTRVFTYKGKEYKVRCLTVEETVAQIKRDQAKRQELIENPIDGLGMVEVMRATIAEMVEGIDDGFLAGIKVEQLAALYRFVRGEDVAPKGAPAAGR